MATDLDIAVFDVFMQPKNCKCGKFGEKKAHIWVRKIMVKK